MLDEELSSDQFLADPYPTYRRLRTDAPVAWSETLQSWILTRYDDVMFALKEPRLSNEGRMRALLEPLAGADRAMTGLIADHYDSTLPFMSGPRHVQVKSILQSAFTTRSVEAMRPGIQATVDALIDDADGERFDIMTQLANVLPINVIGQLLGVPPADRPRFRPWTSAIFALFDGRPSPETIRLGGQSLAEMRAYLAGLIEARRREPGDDLVTELLRIAQREGSPLTEEVVLANCVTLYTAGHETTSGLIGSAFLALFRHPDQLRRLRDDPGLIRGAVEESLRYDTSVQKAWRLATDDVEISGVTIPAGDAVSAMVAAANRDPAHFDDPDRFDIERQIDRHLAFGHGTYFCLGAMLGRMEAAVAVPTFLHRYPNARHSEGALVWGRDRTFRSLAALPVRLQVHEPRS